MRKHLLAIAAPVFLFPLGLRAADLSDVQEKAKQGDAAAQLELGILYARGLGVTRDYDAAVKWFSKAAYRGNITAQIALGPLYGEGYGVQQDYAEAVKLYFKAIDAGENPDIGQGADREQQDAAKRYREAADHGDVYAQRALGLLYKGGVGVNQNYVEAYLWLSLALNNKELKSDAIVANETRSRRDEVKIHLTQEQLSDVERRVREWAPGN